MDLDTALTASIEAGNEALAVGGPDEAAHHFEQALELLSDPARCEALDIDLSKLTVNASEALSASGDPERAAAVIREQLDRLPTADVPPTWRPRMLSAYARALMIIETTIDPLPALGRGGRAGARGRERAAGQGARDPRADPRLVRRPRRRPRRPAWRR